MIKGLKEEEKNQRSSLEMPPLPNNAEFFVGPGK